MRKGMRDLFDPPGETFFQKGPYPKVQASVRTNPYAGTVHTVTRWEKIKRYLKSLRLR